MTTADHVTIAPAQLAKSVGVENPGAVDVAPRYFAVIIFSLVLVYYAVGFPSAALRDPDTLWHIRNGQWMLQHGQWLHSDVYSYTFEGQPWMAKDWLSDVILAVAFGI